MSLSDDQYPVLPMDRNFLMGLAPVELAGTFLTATDAELLAAFSDEDLAVLEAMAVRALDRMMLRAGIGEGHTECVELIA